MKTHIKNYLFLFLLLSTGISVFAIEPVKEKCSDKQSFFTKSDLSNWIYVIRNKEIKISELFKMDDGVLKITGVSSGYLRTKKSYSNYEINLKWRWTQTLGNSGVLLHIQSKDTIWPVCYQVQQKADAAGDIICMNGLWAKECSDSVKSTVPKMQLSNEKPLGEWNSMKVICLNKTIKVYVNAVLQNSISGITVDNGFIGFQNEGTALEFKNLSIINIKTTKNDF